MSRLQFYIGLLCFFGLMSCTHPLPSKNTEDWEMQLKDDINLFGHRNWIVVTDMAYPMQSKPGIKTLYTGAAYEQVLSSVNKVIKEAPHVRSRIYQDKELIQLDDKDVNGISVLKNRSKEILGTDVIYVEHEKLIATLDSVSQIFNVIILKTTLTMPYTSTFFELDCKYWK